MTQLDLFEKIFQIIFPLAALVLTGFFYARKFNPDMAGVNKMNIDIFCPALIFSVVSAKSFDIVEYQTLAILSLLIVLGSGLLALPVCYFLKIPFKTFVPPVMFNNSGNMGLPLMVLAFGESALPVAVVFFIVENTLHFTLGIFLIDSHSNPLSALKMPMILATIVALVVSVFQISVPEYLSAFISMLGQICIPLMLFALGVRMTNVSFSDWKIGLLGAIFTPFSGLLIALLIAYLWPLPEQDFHYLLLFAVLPSAVLNFMIAEKYNQQPQRVASMVLIGNMASIVVIPLTLYFIYS